jgi:transcriptional regulator with XRE-family HTH domain
MYSVEMYQRIRRACHIEGMSIPEAAKQFGMHRKTVKKILSFSIPPATVLLVNWLFAFQENKLDPTKNHFEPYC